MQEHRVEHIPLTTAEQPYCYKEKDGRKQGNAEDRQMAERGQFNA